MGHKRLNNEGTMKKKSFQLITGLVHIRAIKPEGIVRSGANRRFDDKLIGREGIKKGLWMVLCKRVGPETGHNFNAMIFKVAKIRFIDIPADGFERIFEQG